MNYENDCGCASCRNRSNDSICSKCAWDSKWQPITNADHIRSMSDEELARAIKIFAEADVCMNPECASCDDCLLASFCVIAPGEELDWLKQPYKEKE